MKAALYKVSTWDHEKQRWSPYVTRTRKWGVRKILRTLYRGGWDVPTILVERRDVAGRNERRPRPDPVRPRLRAADPTEENP